MHLSLHSTKMTFKNGINQKGQREEKKRQQQTRHVNKVLEKQVEELTKLRKLNTKGLREKHSEIQGNYGAPKSLGGWRQQMVEDGNGGGACCLKQRGG